MEILKSGGEFDVRNWASILDGLTHQQALMTARSPAMAGHLALMPDAHLGSGATIGSVLLTSGIIPAAVGVDIGCGITAMQLDMKRRDIDDKMARQILGLIRKTVPSGVGKGKSGIEDFTAARTFLKFKGMPSVGDEGKILSQFGTLGSGNHFAEVSFDDDDNVWILVHSGSRGIGHFIATHHIKIAKGLGQKVEHPDLAYFPPNSEEIRDYVKDMQWAQDYAYHQRMNMVENVLNAVRQIIPQTVYVLTTISCHHNYSVPSPFGVIGTWLSRKGAIDASEDTYGIIPGSMGTDTYIVRGLGNIEAYKSAPHGAGRLLSRGAAKRQLDLEEFKQQMAGRVWDDRGAQSLLDEAPLAYKPIETVMSDASDLVEPVARLQAFINYKGV